MFLVLLGRYGIYGVKISWVRDADNRCRADDTNSAVGISPCTSGGSSNSFVCGVNTNQCQDDANTFSISSDTGIILRPAQIAALVESTLATAAPSGAIPQVTVTATPNSAGLYTAGTLAGVAVGIALPLLIILGVFFILLRREKRRFSKPKLMYKLPDELNDDLSVHSTVHSLQPPRSIVQSPAFSSYRSSHASGMTSPVDNRGSVRTTGTLASSRPAASPRIRSAQSQTFLERYETMKRNALAQSVDTSESRHELDTPPATTPTKEMPRYELSDTRMSH